MQQNETGGGRIPAVKQETLWEEIVRRQGETFYTAKGLPFTYQIRGGEFFTERKKKSITRATFEKAYQKIADDTEGRIIGPKTLNCFGGPYIWALFVELGIVIGKKGAKNGNGSQADEQESDQ